jgi:hypothetical protein
VTTFYSNNFGFVKSLIHFGQIWSKKIKKVARFQVALLDQKTTQLEVLQ